MTEFAVFQGKEHLPFQWQAQNSACALLVHGFPGTPAEMRPLGQALHDTGWSARSILLPGFGPQIEKIGSCRYEDWLAALIQELSEVNHGGGPALLVGYSLGAALSIHVAAREDLDGLVLLAPFWRLDAGWRGALLPILKLIFPHFRPFEKADFSDPQVRKTILAFAPDVNLDDPEVQAAIRDLSIPSKTIDEIRKAGQSAFRKARQVSVPVLVIQGSQDELAKPEYTRSLTGVFSGSVDYHEVAAGHNLISPDSKAWEEVKEIVLKFAGTLA